MKKLGIAMAVVIAVGVILVAVGCGVCAANGFKFGTEELEYVEKSFECDDSFSSIELSLEDAHKVILQRGERCSVKYSECQFTKITVEVVGDVLLINEDGKDGWNWIERLMYKFKATDVVITVPEGISPSIEGTLDGAVEIGLPNWQFGDIDLRLRGAANVTGSDVVAKDVTLKASGAANINLSGKVDYLSVQASGAVNMRCDSLECPRVDVNASGSAELNLSGIGDKLGVRASGSSKIWAKGFSLSSAEFDASGSITAEVTVSTSLSVRASGSARISYWGNPTSVDKSGSGSAKIIAKN